ncbi:MAG: mannosyltransferase family protein [Patescibacteria group bacterium]|jgi:Gpi18-like mannosyltransferase
MKQKLTKKEIWNIILLFIGWRVVVQFIAFLGKYRLFLSTDNAYDHLSPWSIDKLPEFLQYFVKWDSGFYLEIAKSGYFFDQAKNLYNTAFFPLYPLLIKIFSYVFQSQVISGIIISTLATFGVCYFLYKLAKIELQDNNSALKSVFYFLIFPTAIFLASIYTESLFIFLAVACLYFARTRRFAIASSFGFFVATCRPIGIILFLVLILEYIEQRKFSFKEIKLDILWTLLVPAGLASYMLFLWIKFKNAFLFMQAQTAWDRKIGFDFWGIWIDLKNHVHDIFQPSQNFAFSLRNDFEFFFFITFLILSIVVFFRLRKSYGLYCFLALLIPFLTGSLISMTRFTLVLFPVFILLAKFTIKREWLNYFIIMLFSMMLSLFTVMLANWYWIG